MANEQTLNQSLIEMDIFEGNEGIIVTQTNRSDVLDPALPSRAVDESLSWSP